MIDPVLQEMMLRILLAAILGLVVGFERWYKGKAAGIRTYAFVSMGSALFTVLSIYGFGGAYGVDPSRVAAQVVVGIGFFCAGLIFLRETEVPARPPAGVFWPPAAMGMAVGLGFSAI